MYSDKILDLLLIDIDFAFSSLNKLDLKKLSDLDSEHDYDYLIGDKLAAVFTKNSNFFECTYGCFDTYGFYLSFKDIYTVNNDYFELGLDGDFEIYHFLLNYQEKHNNLPKVFLSDVQISNIFGVPTRTLQNWKNKDQNDWRHNLYFTLKYKGVLLT